MSSGRPVVPKGIRFLTNARGARALPDTPPSVEGGSIDDTGMDRVDAPAVVQYRELTRDRFCQCSNARQRSWSRLSLSPVLQGRTSDSYPGIVHEYVGAAKGCVSRGDCIGPGRFLGHVETRDTAWPPAEQISAAHERPKSSRISVVMTRAPSPASTTQDARPIPFALPVMSATLPPTFPSKPRAVAGFTFPPLR